MRGWSVPSLVIAGLAIGHAPQSDRSAIAANPSGDLPTLIMLDEAEPPDRVNRFSQEGIFTDQGIRYRVDYLLDDTSGRVRAIVNGRSHIVSFPKAAFRGFGVHGAVVRAHSPNDPGIILTVEFGEPFEGCFTNAAPRESLKFVFSGVTRIWKQSYAGCQPRMTDVSESFRIE